MPLHHSLVGMSQHPRHTRGATLFATTHRHLTQLREHLGHDHFFPVLALRGNHPPEPTYLRQLACGFYPAGAAEIFFGQPLTKAF